MDTLEELTTESLNTGSVGVEVEDTGGLGEARKSLKRQRDPLSSSEENVPLSKDSMGSVKRLCLHPPGEENQNPVLRRAGSPVRPCLRWAEQSVKPDTPAVSSIQSRLRALAQRQGGGRVAAPRCLSDPGGEDCGPHTEEEGPRMELRLIGDAEFRSRVERFESRPQIGNPSLMTPQPRILSSFTRSIQQKLQRAMTPSTNRAECIRQEREQELRLLRSQSISDNPWLKRSWSDPFLPELESSAQAEKAGSSEGQPDLDECTDVSIPVPEVHFSFSSEKKLQLKDTGEHEEPQSPAGKNGSTTGKQQEEATSPSGVQEKEAEFPGEQQKKEGSPSDKQQKEEGSPSGEQQKEGSPSGEQQKEAGSPSGEQKKEAGSPSGEQQKETGSPSGEKQKEAGSPSGEQQKEEAGSPSGEQKKEAGSPSGVQKKEAGSPSGEKQKEAGSPSGEQQKEAGSPSGEQQKEAGCPSGEQQKEAGSPSGEQQKEAGCPSGEQQKEAGYPSGEQQKEAGSPSGEQQKEAGSPSGELQKEVGSPSGEQQKEAGSPSGEQQKEAGSPSGEQQKEAGSPSGEQQKEAGSSSGERQEEAEFHDEQQKDIGSPPGDQQKEVWSDEYQEEAQSPSGRSHLVTKSCMHENKVLSSDPQELAGSQPDQQEDELPNEDQKEFPAKEQQEVASPDYSQEEMECSVDNEHGPRHLDQNKVTFDPEPEVMNGLEFEADSRKQSTPEAELDSHEEMNTSEMIDQMFEGVLDMTEEENDEEEEVGSSGATDPNPGQKEADHHRQEGEEEEALKAKEGEENGELDSSEDELLAIPPSCILSPLSKSVEGLISPLSLTSKQLFDPPPLLLTPEELTPPPVVDSTPLYSIDAYRTQSQISQQAVQRVTPVECKHAPESSRPLPPVNIKEKITLLSEEAAWLQSVITQTLQALNCCTDQGHGKGSLEEVEAEKLLLVSCEKRSALLAEVSRLREGTMQEGGSNPRVPSPEPCRGTVTISNLQLPLKVEYLCSTRMRTGQPTHYFFVLIRYGACSIVATPLATVADVQNGDTVSFPTSITLQDIRSSFQIDVEVYSLSRTPANNFNIERPSKKYKVTPKKLLNSLAGPFHSITSTTLPSISSRRSSNFSLVGSHKITLHSLGQSKFPLDKVPFLSPLEGNIYLRLQCESHSHVQHHGFLTMFEDVSGFGAWHRRWFCLEGSSLSYWNYPNDEHTKAAEGSISLASSSTQCVRPVNRDSCARPHTFELVSNRTKPQDLFHPLNKHWFSADRREDRTEWMEKLSQILLDLRTWSPCPATPEPQPSGSSRESIL